MRREKGKFEAVGDILKEGKRPSWFTDKLKSHKIWQSWDRIIGEPISLHAKPFRWQGKTLVISAQNSTWMQELTFLKPQLLERIRKHSPDTKIDDIRFVLGEISARDAGKSSASKRATTSPLSQKQIDSIRTATDGIKDPELREAARKAMRRSLSSKTA